MKVLAIPLICLLFTAPMEAGETDREPESHYYWGVKDFAYVAIFDGKPNKSMQSAMRSWGEERFLRSAPRGPVAQWTAIVKAESWCSASEDGVFCLVQVTVRRPTKLGPRLTYPSYKDYITTCSRSAISRVIRENVESLAKDYHNFQGHSA